MNQRNVIVVRGGGDLASGVIHRLYRSGYRILVLESKRPSAIRREVSFAMRFMMKLLLWKVLYAAGSLRCRSAGMYGRQEKFRF